MEDFLFIYGRTDSHDSCPSFLGSLTDFIGLHQSFLIVRTACAAVARPLYGESYGYHGSTNRELTETFESDPHHARTGNCEPVSLCGQYVFHLYRTATAVRLCIRSGSAVAYRFIGRVFPRNTDFHPFAGDLSGNDGEGKE